MDIKERNDYLNNFFSSETGIEIRAKQRETLNSNGP